MHKILLSLILCLTLSFPALSQNFSTDLITVPRSTVINAITKYNDCKLELQYSQEKLFATETKIKLYQEEIVNLNNLIQNKDIEITSLGEIIKLRDSEIRALKQAKKAKFWNGALVGFGSGMVAIFTVLQL
jgi:peptidoglycan hydrolase CwlO-like protein